MTHRLPATVLLGSMRTPPAAAWSPRSGNRRTLLTVSRTAHFTAAALEERPADRVEASPDA